MSAKFGGELVPVLSTVGAAVSPWWFVTLALVLLVAGGAGWRWACIYGGGPISRMIFALLVGFHVPAIVTLLPVAFSPLSNIAVAALVLAASLFVRRDTVRAVDSRLWLAATAFLCVLMILLALRSGLFTHYDYYLNSNLLSLDLARSGSTASSFAVAHDLHNWVLIQLTTTVALDALEIQVLHSNTGLLSRLFLLFLVAGCLSILSRISVLGMLGFLVLGAAIIAEQSVQFRPHVLVGLFVLLSCLVSLSVKFSGRALFASSFFLALSKRDGLVLAPFIFVLGKVRLNIWLVLCAVVFFLTGAAFIRVGPHSPLWTFITGLTSPEVLQRAASKLLDPGVLLTFAAVVLIGLKAKAFDDAKSAYRCCFMLLVVLGLVVGGSIVLGGAGYWNLGTDDRKVLYIVLPITVGLLSASWAIFWRGNKLFFALYLAVSLTAGGWATYQLSAVRASTGWGDAAVANTRFLRGLIPTWQILKIGVIDKSGASLAPSVLGDLDLYKFQFFVAFNGADLTIANNLDLLADRDVILVPPADVPGLSVPEGWEWLRPYGFYSALVKVGTGPIDDELLVKSFDGGVIHEATSRVPIQPFDLGALEDAGIQVNATAYPSGETNLVFSLSPQSAVSITARVEMKPGSPMQFLTFRAGLSGAPLPKSVVIQSGGRRREFPLDTIVYYDSYYIPVPSGDEFTVELVPKEDSAVMGIMALAANAAVGAR